MKYSIITAALAPLALAQSLCEQYGYTSGGGYEINNNMWGKNYGSGNQCTYVDRISSSGAAFRVNWQWNGGDNNVKAYPNAGRQLSQKKLVSNIGSIPSTYSWRYDNTNIRCNVAYDLFTAADPNHATSSGDYELMIWLGRYGNVYPIGSSTGTVNVAGRNWELFVGYNGAMKVYSYVAPSAINSWSGDIKQFFNHMASQGFPANNQYLITLQAGTEPFTGGSTTLTVSQFSADVN